MGIFKGTTSQLQLDEDFEKELYGTEEYINLSNKLRVKESKDLSDTSAISRVNERQQLGLPFDTSDSQTKKDLNTYFEKVVAPIIDNDNQDQVISTFIDKFSFIPDIVKSNLLAGLHNGSDEEISRTSRLIDSLTRSNPQLARQFSATNDLIRAKTITSAVQAGMPIEDAVKAADNMIVQKGTVEQELRRKSFREAKIEFDQDEISTFFTNDPNKVPQGMKDDWSTLVENYSVNLKTPIENAKDIAYRVVDSEWGATNVGSFEEDIKLTEAGKVASPSRAAILESQGLLKEFFPKEELSYMKYAPENSWYHN